MKALENLKELKQRLAREGIADKSFVFTVIDDTIKALHEAANGNKSDVPYQIKANLKELLNYYNDKLINHRSGMMTLIDQAVNDYEKNVRYLKELLGLADVDNPFEGTEYKAMKNTGYIPDGPTPINQPKRK